MSEAAGERTTRDDDLVFSTRLVIPMLRFFEDAYGRQKLEELGRSLGMSVESLERPDEWVSSALVKKLSQKMVELTGDALVTYRAGLALSTRKVAGPTWYLGRALGSPQLVYQRIAEYNPHLSKITRWEVDSVTAARAVLRFVVLPGHSDDRLFCLNRQGGLAGIPTAFDLPPARVEHPRCIHEGAAFCEYRLTWVPPGFGVRAATVASLVASLVVAPLVGFGTLPLSALWGPTALVAATVTAALLKQRRQMRAIVGVTRDQIDDLRGVIEENLKHHRERTLLDKIDQLTRRELAVDTLVDTVLKEITTTLGYDRAMLLQVDRARGVLGHTRGIGYARELRDAIDHLSLKLEPASSDPRLFANVLRSNRALLVRDVESFRRQLQPENQALVAALGTRGFIAVPVRASDEPLGLLVVDQVNLDRDLDERDTVMLEQLAHTVGMALANARLVDDLRRQHRDLQTSLLVNQKFAQYLPRTVVDRIRQDPESALRLGGHPIKAAILFSDVVGFTPWSERHDPEAVVSFLNAYFASMDRSIAETRGILDKRMGDGMMVVFVEEEGAVADNPARRALSCGLGMQRALRHPIEVPPGADFEGLRVRIGISYGELVAGNLGSSHRIEYTVIGDVVNVAARLEAQCPPGSIYATDAAVEAGGPGFRTEKRGGLEVKGRKQPVITLEVMEME